MKITFSINKNLMRDEIFEGLKKVLFLSMLKLQELAVIYAPVDKGLLRSRINLYPATMGYTIYSLVDEVTYAAAVEFGTSPRTITAVKKKALKFKIDGREVIVKSVQHPGTEAQPYFRPALDQVKHVWVRRFGKQVFG